MGSVSGGCVEGAVVTEALEAMEDGQSRILTFGVSDETAFAVGLACGGTIRVLVEPVGKALPEDLLADLVAARAAKHPVAYAVHLESWARSLLRPGQDGAADLRLRSDKAGFEEDGRFIAPHNPPLRLIVVGAVHIAQPLVANRQPTGPSEAARRMLPLPPLANKPKKQIYQRATNVRWAPIAISPPLFSPFLER